MEGSDRKRQLDGEQPDRPGSQHRRSHHCGCERRPLEEDHCRCPRRNSSTQGGHQYDGRPAPILRVRSDPSCSRGRNGGKTRRAGACARRRGNMEGPYRQRQRDVRQSDRPGAQHRSGHDGRRSGRSFSQDHGRRARRDPRAQRHDQHDGRPAQWIRVRSDAGRARSGHGRPARRSSAGAGRRRNMEGPDRQRQLDGRQSDGAGSQHRRGGDGHRRRGPIEKDHGQRQRRDPCNSKRPSTRWSTNSTASPER